MAYIRLCKGGEKRQDEYVAYLHCPNCLICFEAFVEKGYTIERSISLVDLKCPNCKAINLEKASNPPPKEGEKKILHE